MGLFDKKSKHVRELVKYTIAFDGNAPLAKRADYRRAYSTEYVNVIGMTEDFKFITEETPLRVVKSCDSVDLLAQDHNQGILDFARFMKDIRDSIVDGGMMNV
ncbi:Oidioi.mRNA.OKI2018_I69.PAR.g10880.t1.cds [Oikopleura dioica]|uniref:Oidioi.mRNA.OKI2018_I69.PAR.g10880.t1.cds n=1 Tax=Oikopleura dioica TaxID=34765 RepID=A0ABN7RWF2_OIKDI|nr:Oidioi.mRNA.OKI2018_I69.PAR.g10880.t1.cds [Oikopleura dioica]